jgi:putative transport protein
MMHWLRNTFQTYPELAVFLALCIGFYVGRLKFRGFSLGTVASTLLAGMLIGQMHITISAHVQAIFFVMFLFAVGYNAGPGFFSSLRKEGVTRSLFAIAMCAVSILSVFCIALIMHYDKGQAAGLFGGSQTASPIIGVASTTISQLSNISMAERQRLINEIPVCFAITYIFGTAGTNWLLTTIGPRMLGGITQVKAECRELEAKMSGAHGKVGLTPSNSSFNAFRVTEQSIARNKTVRELEDEFISHGHRIFIRRLRKGDTIHEASPDMQIHEGDVIAMNGRRSFVLPELNIGTEVIDEELLSFPIVVVPVYAANKESTDVSVKDLALKDYMYGVIIQSITRGGIRVPMYVELKIEKGDQLELLGLQKDVERATTRIGYAEVSTEKTNMVFVGLGIVLGGIIGAFTFQLGTILRVATCAKTIVRKNSRGHRLAYGKCGTGCVCCHRRHQCRSGVCGRCGGYGL